MSGEAVPSRAASTTPVTPATNDEATREPKTIRSTRTPARRAACGLPPEAYR